MNKPKDILQRIKQKVKETEPSAQVYLFGSYARGNQNKDSDIDILVLLNKEDISYEDEKRIKYPLYDLEFETGLIISPLVLSRKKWESRLTKTPFYINIIRERIML